MKFRKKPVVIEAVQWDEEKETFALLVEMGMQPGSYSSGTYETKIRNLEVRTLEGFLAAKKGDWIIKGVKGEFYPCKPDIFEATYEPVKDDAPALFYNHGRGA